MRMSRSYESIGVDDFPVVVSCTEEESMTRQEYALQTDLAYQVQRFGVGQFGQSGIVDYDNLDLTTAIALVNESAERWAALPQAIRQRYGSWAAIEKAAKSGELEQVLKAAGVPPSSSGGTSAASPSDSAAGVKADA